MPKVCSIPYCGATTQNARDRSFHQFPQDSNLRTAWIKRVGRENFQPSSNSSICSHHFGTEHFRQPNNETPAQFRKATLKQGSLPTYNLVDFSISESFAMTSSRSNNFSESDETGSVSIDTNPAKTRFRRRKSQKSNKLKATSTKAKKRKLHREFSNESPKNEDLHHNAALATKNTLPVVNHDENIAPEERHSTPPEEEHSLSPDVSKSRRKVPRSHVRKVVRTDLQGKDQEETNVTQPLLVAKCETTSNERFQEPECSERQVDNMVQDVTKCRVLTSPRNENIQTVSRSGVINVTGETTLIEEDYQRKYFHLLNTMNDLQDKFLVSQRNFEDLVKAREAFIEELKGKLESNHREIGSIKQDLETSHNKISELEEEKKLYDEKIQNLSGKVEGLKVMEAEVKHQVLKSREEDELQRTTEKQQEVLDFYKLLTSITIEKTIEDEKEDSPTSYDKFRCSVKTAQAQVLQFMLSYDSEFAEVEYTPLNLNSVDSSFPEYLKEQIFFESAQAPNFLRRLIEAFQKPNEK